MKTKQPTREKILDAVFALVYVNGYNGTSMAMILKECGIPKGSLYHYFKSKKEM
ncbi:MAG: TetR/AcrR family transcriptional regulator, partial [Campylobacterota bacterium]|nr:TetR/AcrR family transcriptional regulator [Campylobacterota bacterium]